MDPHALVISLSTAAERLRFQTRQLASLGLTFERIDAIAAASIPEAEYRSVMYQWERPLSRNEVACMMSHRLAWREIIVRNRPTLVLEDDAILSQNLAQFIRNLNPQPNAAIAYNLETSTARKLIARGPAGEPIAGYWLKRIYYDRGGAAAYVMTPQAAALAIAQSERTVAQSDALLNHLAGVTRYQVEPALAMQLHAIQAPVAPETQVAARSTNTRPQAVEKRLTVWLRHPRMKLRRIKTNLAKTVTKISRSRIAESRVVHQCPTIQGQVSRLAA